MTIEVTQTAPTVVGTTQVTLPFYYTCGSYSKFYCCMTEDLTLLVVYNSKFGAQIEAKIYDDQESVSFRLENDMRDKLYARIDEAVFQHKFSEAHRELFYFVNPELKPKA